MINRNYIYLFHILFVGPLLIYLGLNRCKVPDWVWTLLIALGVGVLGYHGYSLYKSISGSS